MRALAAAAAQRNAITCGSVTVTASVLEQRTNQRARALAELGVRMGDYVTIELPNGIEFLEAAIGALKLGAVPQPVS